MNSDKTKLRRYEDNLNVSGVGVTILGAWSIVKLFMQILLSANGEVTMEQYEAGEYAVAVVIKDAGVNLLCRKIFIITPHIVRHSLPDIHTRRALM